MTFIDDYSRFTWIYLLRCKSDVFYAFQMFLAMIDNQFSKSIKIFHSNSGKEYMSSKFQEHLQQKGFLSQRNCPYAPKKNGVAERKN